MASIDLTRPNGLAFSPDERYLFVANSDHARKIWMRFEVRRDGALENGGLFYDATSATQPGVPDGMKVDRTGNLYCTGPGGIWIFSPAGTHLGTIDFPEIPANCAWGDEDAMTLYVTARTSRVSKASSTWHGSDNLGSTGTSPVAANFFSRSQAD